MKYLALYVFLLVLACEKKEPDLVLGRYQVIDAEYSKHQYQIEREFQAGSDLYEQHWLNNCLIIDIAGQWTRKGNTLNLQYARQRTRDNCKDSLSAWDTLHTELKIPIRTVDAISFESYLPPAPSASEKWLRWQLKKLP